MGDLAVVADRVGKRFPLPRSWIEIARRPFSRRFKTVLDGVSLAIGRGEVFGLLGPNGSGKTTLLKILATLLVPTTGRATVDGHDVVEATARARHAVGYCLETERSFYYRLTGRQNLEFFAALSRRRGEAARARIAEVLKIVGLTDASDEAFMVYSSGMRQRLGLARALLTDPAVLILDEPTRGVDPAASADFRRFLVDTLAGTLGKTVVLATHSLEEAACCHRAAVMRAGRIAAQGPWPEVARAL